MPLCVVSGNGPASLGREDFSIGVQWTCFLNFISTTQSCLGVCLEQHSHFQTLTEYKITSTCLAFVAIIVLQIFYFLFLPLSSWLNLITCSQSLFFFLCLTGFRWQTGTSPTSPLPSTSEPVRNRATLQPVVGLIPSLTHQTASTLFKTAFWGSSECL